MRFQLTIMVYNTGEICHELAKRRGRAKPYTRQYMNKLLHAFWKHLGIQQPRMWITNDELELLDNWRRKLGRPPKKG